MKDIKTLQDKTRRVGVGCQKETILRSEVFGVLLFVRCLEGFTIKSPRSHISAFLFDMVGARELIV